MKANNWYNPTMTSITLNGDNMAYAEIAGAVFFGLPAFWIIAAKIIEQTGKTRTNFTKSEAEFEMINVLREEVKRMAAINLEMISTLQDLQTENLALRREVSLLHDTIRSMNQQLHSLGREE